MFLPPVYENVGLILMNIFIFVNLEGKNGIEFLF